MIVKEEGIRKVGPVPAGFGEILPAVINAYGIIIKKFDITINSAEAEFVKFPGRNPVVATNLDPAQSALLFVTDAGRMAVAQRFFPVGDFLPFVTTLASAIVPLKHPPS